LENVVLTGSVSNWVSPGGTVSGFTLVSSPTATLNVTGNAVTIPAGNLTTSTGNFTDFGSALSRTFMLQNIGTGTLHINTSTLTGGNANEFSLTPIGSSTLGTSASGSLQIFFIPTTVGTKS